MYKYGGTSLHAQLLKFYRVCWTTKELPKQFKDALIIPKYIKKGDRSDFGNCRDISIAGIILQKILLKRLQTIADVMLLESQCRFQRSCSTTDRIFTLRQLQEKQLNNNKASSWSSLTCQKVLTQWTGQPC